MANGLCRIDLNRSHHSIRRPWLCGVKTSLSPNTHAVLWRGCWAPLNETASYAQLPIGVIRATLSNPDRLMIKPNVFALHLMVLAGCNTPASSVDHGHSARVFTGELASKGPYIQGAVTMLSEQQILVEENAAQASGSAKASLRLTDSTRVLHRSGVTAHQSDLRIGQWVQVWVVDPVMESYPAKGTAAAIVMGP